MNKVQERDGKYFFKNELNRVHLDEKWFYLVPTTGDVKMIPEDEFEGDDTAIPKSHISKVMFLSAVGVPQKKPDGTIFDGKIGIWPFIETVAAKKNTTNRAKGTPEIKPINVDVQAYRKIITMPGGLLDAVRDKMSWLKGDAIILQYDGAKPHNEGGNAAAFAEAGKADGWNITFETQPVQSPDLNMNDLCFFYSLQQNAAAYRTGCKSLEDMINAVTQAYTDYCNEQLERVHALTFEIFREILTNHGGNQYVLPNTGILQNQSRSENVVDDSISKELVDEIKLLIR